MCPEENGYRISFVNGARAVCWFDQWSHGSDHPVKVFQLLLLLKTNDKCDSDMQNINEK